jgi:hypothetical protein
MMAEMQNNNSNATNPQFLNDEEKLEMDMRLMEFILEDQ